MSSIYFQAVALLLLTSISSIKSLPPGRLWPSDLQDTRVSPLEMEEIQELQMHDPLENRGVILEEGHLIEGDIRRGPVHQLTDFPLFPAAMAGWSKHEVAPDLPNSRNQGQVHQLRNAVPFRDELWTDRIVPFQLDYDFNITERAQIHLAMAEIMEGSGHCITFVNRTNQPDFVYITARTNGCYSGIGRKGGNQTISVDRTKGCVKKGIIMHELMHALGFWHEHTRQDRNNYIKVLTENIQDDHVQDFNKQEGIVQNISYDFYSIMHYSTSMFALNSQLKTIQILVHGVPEAEVGQRKYLSDKDKERIRKRYQCPTTKCSYPRIFNDESVHVVNTSVGSSIVYSCTRNDLVLVGATERTCLFDGMWSGSQPLCFRTSAAMSLCDFETPGICGWTQDTTDEADWTRYNSHTDSADTGPLVDHTKQNSEGYYMYFEGSHINVNATARLISPLLQAESNICVLFWYNMYGAGMGTMRVKIRYEDDRSQTLWQQSGNQNFGWKMDLIANINPAATPQSPVPYRIVFEGVRGPFDTTDMAIDDVMIGPCTEISSYQGAVIHEHKEGSYVYIETSHGHVSGSTASMYSPVMKSSGYLCFTFNYHMYGSDVGNLTLYLHQDTGSSSIWTSSGDHGVNWLEAHAQVYVGQTFKIEMVAEMGSGFKGDIAVDNVEITTGKCPKVIQCDFDDTHFCDLHNDLYTDDFDWTIAHGGHILSPSTGPRFDHSSGHASGQFVYVEASSPRSPGDVARLLTPYLPDTDRGYCVTFWYFMSYRFHCIFNRSGQFAYIEASSPRISGDVARLLTPYLPVTDRGYCVTFWYFMYGQDVAVLRLVVRRDDRSKDVLWERRGDLGPVWLNAKVNLPACDYTLQIIFEAEVGASYKSDIALDDVTISEGRCA